MRALWTLLILFGLTSLQGCCFLGLFSVKYDDGAAESKPVVKSSDTSKKDRDRQAAELAKVAETTKTDKGILVKLKGDVLFEKGKRDLSQDAAGKIKGIADVVKKYPKDKITVVGHTDNSGTVQGNLSLSKSRANAVKAELVKNGVPEERVSAVGKGDKEPVAPNDTDENRAKNRRAELKIENAE